MVSGKGEGEGYLDAALPLLSLLLEHFLDVVDREVDVGLRAVDEHVDLPLPVRAQPPHALLERLAQRLVKVRARVS